MSVIPPDMHIDHPLVHEYEALERTKEEIEEEIEKVDTQVNIAPNKTGAKIREGLSIFHRSHLLEEMVCMFYGYGIFIEAITSFISCIWSFYITLLLFVFDVQVWLSKDFHAERESHVVNSQKIARSIANYSRISLEEHIRSVEVSL